VSEAWKLSAAALGGFALGVFFFVGLWWTVRRGVASPQPAVIFLGSMLVRTLVVMAGFYFLSRGDWRNLVASLAGFVLARVLVTRNASFLPQAKALLPMGRAQ
jgi:F1F0 ATPase subunit 2